LRLARLRHGSERASIAGGLIGIATRRRQDLRLELRRLEFAIQQIVDADPLVIEQIGDEKVIAQKKARLDRVQLAITASASGDCIYKLEGR
jgi:hypothetical protein